MSTSTAVTAQDVASPDVARRLAEGVEGLKADVRRRIKFQSLKAAAALPPGPEPMQTDFAPGAAVALEVVSSAILHEDESGAFVLAPADLQDGERGRRALPLLILGGTLAGGPPAFTPDDVATGYAAFVMTPQTIAGLREVLDSLTTDLHDVICGQDHEGGGEQEHKQEHSSTGFYL